MGDMGNLKKLWAYMSDREFQSEVGLEQRLCESTQGAFLASKMRSVTTRILLGITVSLSVTAAHAQPVLLSCNEIIEANISHPTCDAWKIAVSTSQVDRSLLNTTVQADCSNGAVANAFKSQCTAAAAAAGGGTPTSGGGTSGGADQACEDAHSTASTICLEPETTMGIAMGTSVVAGLTSMMQGSSGTAETCKNQSTIGGLVALLNGGWAAACGTLTYRCRSACAQPENPNATWNPGNKSHFADCKQYYNSAMALAGMAASFAAYTASAKNCEKAANLADSQCLTPESMQRPECRDFCARNPTSPVCVKVDCNDPTQQASNPKCMTFKTPNGPLNPGGPGNFGGGGNSYSSNNPGSFSDPLDDILGGNQFKGGPAVPSTTTNKGVPGGGGGGGGLGGGGGGAAASRGGGGGGQPPSITTDGGSAGASGGGGGGGGGFSGGNGGYGNNAAAGGKEKFNLNDYLPFGKLDPKRKLAALQVNQPGGVSGANGLSNWEKVSRRMQVMRGKLQK